MRRVAALVLTILVLAAVVLALRPERAVSRTEAVTDFTHFESGQVHPLAITPDGTRLLAVNTADGRLTVFSLAGPVPTRIAEVPVGLEPVSVALRDDNEAWVVNHLSDDISIVNLRTMHVRATLRVGDEPSDVVFAGTPTRAWVSVSQEDAIKLYDPSNLATAPQVLAVPARQPRSLAVSADGGTVYAAILDGNDGTTVLTQAEAGDSLPAPQPPMSTSLPAAPKTGLIVQFTNGHWRDVSGKLWDLKVPYSVPRVEVVRYSTANPAAPASFGGLATSMFAAAVNPTTGTCAAIGTEARTEVRFEPNLRGHTTEGRVALIPTSGSATSVPLNPHINYAVPFGPPSERDSSLAIPTGATWSNDGQRLYVTAMGSARIAVLDAAGQVLTRVRTVQGPTGAVVDGARGRLYVLGRFRGELQTFSTGSLQSLSIAPLGFDPTPDEIVAGRRFFYGGATSGHGDQACASCHFYGDMDNLAWDLGDPTGTMAPVPAGMIDPLLTPMHPMKGPMTTQSLRAIGTTGVLHWRGDRNNFQAFVGATKSLLGLSAQIPDSEMVAMQQFVLPLVYPPNPRQRLDRSFPDAPTGQPSAERGRVFYANTPVDGARPCAGCHALPSGTNGQSIDRVALRESQDMKVPQLRNLYQKTGFTDAIGAVNKRGAGFTHDGATDNLFDFLKFPGFNFASGTAGDAQRRDLEAYLLAFDTGLAPAVGAEVTFDGGTSDAARMARMDTLVARADAADCDLVAHGRVSGVPHGWFYDAGVWQMDVAGQPTLTSAQLRALALAGQELTVMGVPRGAGTRMALDRDRDGSYDGDELAAGSDPGNPVSTPSNVGVDTAPLATRLQAARPNPFRGGTHFEFSLAEPSVIEFTVFDVLGREVRHLAPRQKWPARDAHDRVGRSP
jgi:YVTN family beta-propeller protein